MAVSPAEFLTLSQRFTEVSRCTISFFDTVDSVANQLKLNEHPEAIDIKQVMDFQRFVREVRSIWPAYRHELERTSDNMKILAHMWFADEVALLPMEEVEMLREASMQRIQGRQQGIPQIDVNAPSARQMQPMTNQDLSALVTGMLMAIGGFFTLGLAIGSMWK